MAFDTLSSSSEALDSVMNYSSDEGHSVSRDVSESSDASCDKKLDFSNLE